MMKTERRHELQHNSLVDILADVGENAKPYAKGLLGVALAALVVVCAYLYLSKRAEAEEGASWDKTWQAIDRQDMEGLREVVKTYPNKPAAIWSQLVLADMELSSGVTKLFVQKSTGRDLIRTALDDYQNVAEHAVHPQEREHALFGIGRSQESLDQLSKAREAYEQLVKNYPSGPYEKRAQQRLDELARDSAKNWYDWFEATEPPTSNIGKGSPFASPLDEKGPTGPSLPPLPPGFEVPDVGKTKNPPPEPKPIEPKTVEPNAKADESKGGEGKSSDAKSGDAAKATDAKPTDAKSEAKAADGKDDKSKSEPAKSDSPKPAPAAPDSSKPAAEKSAAGK
jgi:tetratricopeptide (TPR) repeat protein